MIPMDKQAHFWWGMSMTAMLWPLMSVNGFFVACAVGFLKEVMDSRRGRFFDVRDLFATCVGGFIAAILQIVFGYLTA